MTAHFPTTCRKVALFELCVIRIMSGGYAYVRENERVVLVDADMPLARMAQNNKIVNQTALSKETLVKFFGENGGISRLQEEILIEGRNASLSECIPENEIDW